MKRFFNAGDGKILNFDAISSIKLVGPIGDDSYSGSYLWQFEFLNSEKEPEFSKEFFSIDEAYEWLASNLGVSKEEISDIITKNKKSGDREKVLKEVRQLEDLTADFLNPRNDGKLSSAQYKSLTAYIDGATNGNPGPAGVGVVFVKDEKVVEILSKPIGVYACHEAEYLSLITALEEALARNVKSIKVFSNSKIVVNQINGYYRIHSLDLQKLYNQAKKLIKEFTRFEISYVPKGFNRQADCLAKIACMSYGTIDSFAKSFNESKKETSKKKS